MEKGKPTKLIRPSETTMVKVYSIFDDGVGEDVECQTLLGDKFKAPREAISLGDYVIIRGSEICRFEIDEGRKRKIKEISEHTGYAENFWGYAYFSDGKITKYVGTDFNKFVDKKYDRCFVLHYTCPGCLSPIEVDFDDKGMLAWGARCGNCGKKNINMDNIEEEMFALVARANESPRYHPPAPHRDLVFVGTQKTTPTSTSTST